MLLHVLTSIIFVIYDIFPKTQFNKVNSTSKVK